LSNKDRSKQDTQADARKRDNSRDNTNRGEEYRSTDLNNSPMMTHLMDAMKSGEDVGEYGRLTFVMVARHFLSDEEMLKLLEGQPDMDETQARALITQVRERGYNPPKRERILQWQERQEFQICPEPDDPNGCNVYRELQFPDEIYSQIDDFWEEKAQAEDDQ
jgi:hypothetical protein